MYKRESNHTSARRVICVLACLLLAAPALGQSKARDSILAIQRQVDTIESGLVKSTVGLRLGGVSGSGVIISPDGYVLTAAHVIRGGQRWRCYVVMPDGSRTPADVLGSNRDDDFGLIKIRDAKDLPAAQLGDSAALRRGEWILATGHPLGVKTGRPPVLRIGRVLRLDQGHDGREPHLITTDAPLISGDSGGPLFDLTGRVVGIHSMISDGGRRMVSLHVPINLAKRVLAQMKQGDNPSNEEIEHSPFSSAMRNAEASLRDSDKATAIQAALRAAELDSTSAMARVLLGEAYARNGQTGPAVAAVREACSRGFIDAAFLRQDYDFERLQSNADFQSLLIHLEALNGVPGERKGDRALLATVARTEPNLGHGVVRVEGANGDVALGAVVSADGDVLTKASELPEGTLQCALPDGRTVPAERRGVDSEWDVALLKVKARGLEPLPLADSAALGHWTISPDPSGAVEAVGVIGVADMPVEGHGIAPKPTSKAYIGVRLDQVDLATLRQLGLTGGVPVFVEPGQPASRAGMKTGDVVYELDNHPVADAEQMMDLLVDKKPGDSLSIRVARGQGRLKLNVNLVTRPADLPGRGGLAEMLSGQVSHMAGPFPHVLHHDAVLPPTDMGGPVLDTDGRCIGLNIARADRTSTYAIPAKDLQAIYSRLKSKL